MGIVDGQALADAVEKVVGGSDGAVVQFGAGAVVNAVKLVLCLTQAAPSLASRRECRHIWGLCSLKVSTSCRWRAGSSSGSSGW